MRPAICRIKIYSVQQVLVPSDVTLLSTYNPPANPTRWNIKGNIPKYIALKSFCFG